MPIFIEMGRQVTHGFFPFVTLKEWFGGSMAGEYAFGVFNPFIVAFGSMFYLFFDNLNHAAAVFAIFHLVLFGLGVFAICGSLRCRFPESAFAAIVAGTGIWLIYWAAMSWALTEASLAWLAWTIAAAIRLRHESAWLFPTALLIAITLASGTPHTDVSLVVFIGLLLLHMSANDGWRACSTLLLAAIGGAMLAAPSLLPLVAYHAFSTRPSSYLFAQWSVPIYAFASIGLPVFLAPWMTWYKWDVYGFPVVYLDWAVPLILLKAWRDERLIFKDEYVQLFGWLTLAFLVLCMMPNVTTLRWSFRFLPTLHLFLIVMVARVLTVRRTSGIARFGWDCKVIAAAVVPPVAVSVFTALVWRPDFQGPLAPNKLALVGACTLLAVLLFMWTRRWRLDWRLGMLTAGHAIIFLSIVIAYPNNPSTPRYNLPEFRHAAIEPVFGARNTLFLYDWPVRSDGYSGWMNIHPEDRSTWLFSGASPLDFGGNAINGTSGMKPYAVEQFFAFGDDGEVFSDPLPRLFSTDPKTGAPFADLMRIDSIVAEKGAWIAAAERTVPASWRRRILGGGEGMLFRRPPIEHSLPGTLSYVPNGVEAKLLAFSDRREEYEISVSPEYNGRPVVFARAWYPGYQVRLNGTAVKYQLAGDILPELVLPADFSGTLEIAYLPAGFLRGCLLSGVAAVGLLVAALRLRREAVPRPGLAR